MRYLLLAAVASSLVFACSGGDSAGPTGADRSQETNEPSGSSGSSGATSSGGGSSSGGSSSGGSTSSSSSSSSSSSGGADAGRDSGAAGGGKADLGASCHADGDCTSNVCFQGGSQSYCSLKCDAGDASTVCVPPAFNGSCNKQGYCRKP